MFFAYSIHYVSVFYSYLYNYSTGNGSQQQFVQYYIYTYIQNLHIKHQTCYVQSPGIHVSVIPVGNEKYTKWKSNSSIFFYIQHIYIYSTSVIGMLGSIWCRNNIGMLARWCNFKNFQKATKFLLIVPLVKSSESNSW